MALLLVIGVLGNAQEASGPEQGGGLVIVGVVGPQNVVLTEAHPSASKPVAVILENRSPRPEIIPDAASLQNLVALQIKPLGAATTLQPELAPPKNFPLTVRQNQKLTVVFQVTFDRAGSSADVNGFRYAATVNQASPVLTTVVNPESGSLTVAPATAAASTNVTGTTRLDRDAGVKPFAATQKITASPMQVALKKGQSLSDPITFTASGAVSWSPGDAAPGFKETATTLRCQWSMAGDHTVGGYFFSPPPGHEVKVTIHVIQVMLQAELSGASIGISTKTDRSRMFTATVTPASQANNVTIRVSKGGGTLHVDQQPGDTGTGIVPFVVKGIGTTGSKAQNDCTIEADVGGKPAATADVTVVVPKFVTHQTIISRDDHNYLAYQSNGTHAGSSPAAPGAPVYPQVRLATFYGFKVEVEVADQFNQPIDDPKLYLHAEVFEDFGAGHVGDINQQIQNGSTYIDPVGIPGRDFNPGRLPVVINSTAATHFLQGAPTFPGSFTNRTVDSDFSVRVDGFPLQPPIHRTLTIFGPPNEDIKLKQTP